MSNDVLRHEVAEVMALLQEQLADIAAMQRKQAELTANAAMLAWRASLSREGAAWGEDKIGDQFANGGGGYQAQLEWVDGSVVAKNGLLDHYSRVLKVAADSFERDDQG